MAKTKTINKRTFYNLLSLLSIYIGLFFLTNVSIIYFIKGVAPILLNLFLFTVAIDFSYKNKFIQRNNLKLICLIIFLLSVVYFINVLSEIRIPFNYQSIGIFLSITLLLGRLSNLLGVIIIGLTTSRSALLLYLYGKINSNVKILIPISLMVVLVLLLVEPDEYGNILNRLRSALSFDLLFITDESQYVNPTNIHLRSWLIFNWFHLAQSVDVLFHGFGLYQTSMDSNSWVMYNYSEDIANIFYDNGNMSIIYQTGLFGYFALLLAYLRELKRRFSSGISIYALIGIFMLGMLVPIFESLWHIMVFGIFLSRFKL